MDDWIGFAPLFTFRDKAIGLIRGHGDSAADGDIVCLAPCRSIHTFFMKEPIDVAFVSRGGKVVRAERGLPPHRMAVCARADFTIERFASPEPWFEVGDDVTMAFHAVGRGEGGEQ